MKGGGVVKATHLSSLSPVSVHGRWRSSWFVSGRSRSWAVFFIRGWSSSFVVGLLHSWLVLFVYGWSCSFVGSCERSGR